MIITSASGYNCVMLSGNPAIRDFLFFVQAE